MQEKYLPGELEAAAQAHWNAPNWQGHNAYRVHENAVDRAGQLRPKFYACSMLPYPSGKLHMGHVRNYTINDMLTRFLRMKGYNVLMPMGWDAFGLPAENAAMKNKVPPAAWTYTNIAQMKGQMQAMGLAIDWSRELATCQPEYYKWNQWLFLKMLEAGIAVRRTQVVNWDPVDQTVLANEQVIDGKGWRSGAVIEKREIPGYYLNIVHYAEELLSAVANPEDPNYLSGWPDRVRLMQENWIGKSEGVRFAFPHTIAGADGALIQDGRLYVFTTRADTIMGVTFCAVAPEHPLAAHAAATPGPQQAAVAAFIHECGQGGTTEAELATQEKKGVRTGLSVTHPLTGAAVEVWVGNYVLMGYGDGAVMGVPAHDERDFAFAKKYGIEIKQVVSVAGEAFSSEAWAEWYGDKQKAVCIHSGALDGLPFKAAVHQVAELLAAKALGEKKTTWRLRDWGISRQRYWGTPIPIIHCDGEAGGAPGCGVVPVPEQDLPVVLPEDLIPDGSGSPLKHCASFLNVACPRCGKPARRETDTMDTFIDSSWYFMRYCEAPSAEGSGADPRDSTMVGAGTRYWMQGTASGADGHSGMDQYIGGIEHAILHLLYARFWTKVMRDLKLISFSEPFKKLLTQGMVLNHIYSRRTEQGGIDYFWPDDLDNVFDAGGKIVGAKLRSDGSAVDYGGVGTMSKSKNNGVDPQALIDKYGADTARLFVMFASPPEQTLEWNDAGVEGAHRFLRRVWAFGAKHEAPFKLNAPSAGALSPAARTLRRELHLVLKQISFDYERMQYNTVVSGAMKLLKALEEFAKPAETLDSMADKEREALGWSDTAGGYAVLSEGFSLLLRCLYPACPHLTHALWSELGYADRLGDLLDAPWPEIDESALVQDEVELMLQINGKLRGALKVAAAADKAAIEATALAALADPELAKFTEGRAVKKVVVVPGRLVNLVA